MRGSNQITIVVKAMDGFVDKIVKKFVLDIVANLVRAPSEGGTPVDTGWARANWVPHIGGPAVGTAGTRGSVSLAAQQAGIAQVATSYKHQMGEVHISNNVPYIHRLNEGHSRQAPAGFVQLAVLKAATVDIRGVAA